MEDNRNCNVTNKIFEVLDNVKGFEVAMGNPRKGNIIARYGGINFYISIDPIFNDNGEGRKAEGLPFEEIVRTHKYVFR